MRRNWIRIAFLDFDFGSLFLKQLIDAEIAAPIIKYKV